MKKISARMNYNKETPEPRYNLNQDSPMKKENLNFNSYNISSQNPNSRLINMQKYNNIRPITQPKKNINSNYLHCPSCFCPSSHYHIHHFHIPHTYTHICPRLNKLEGIQSNEDLLKEISELKEECKKFKDELEKTKSENEIGNKYIKLLENKINLKQYDIKDPSEEMLGSKYHSMLDKSFEVLNSVSNKCEDEKGKLRGNVYYYSTKGPDYDSLIEAQKRWLDNLPEKYCNYIKNNFNNNNNAYNNSTFSNTNEKFGEFDNDNSHYNEKYFNNMRNFNKTSDSNINNNIKDNSEIIIKKNPNTFPEFNLNNNNYNEPNNFGYNITENKEPDLEEQIPQEEMDNEQEEMENIEQQNDNMNINNNINKESSEEEENPLNERYIIMDKDGNPIIIGGQILHGMKLIPLIGEDGKEELDENGNIILIGPDGQPKSQDELEPILLDDDRPLVNEENRPFLGINGIPLINELGSPILGPGELYDRNNKVVKGVLGVLQKDNYGNPKKIEINQNKNNLNNNKNINDINEVIVEEENFDNDNDNNNDIENNNIIDNNNNNELDIEKLRPLIGKNGLPVRDSENNFVFLDENNKPVKNTGLYLLLDQNGKPVLNSKSKPILINSEGKPINLIDDDKNNFNNNQIINAITDINNKIPKKNEEDNNKKGEIKYPKFNKKKIEKRKPSNKNNNRYNKILMNESQNLRDKRYKGQYTYSEVSSDEFKKIQFTNNSSEYKGNCFACDVGCSVSRSGYSPMNFVPYNNMIRRREVTPVKRIRKKKVDGDNNIRVNKTDIEGDNNYYLTEE